MSVEELELYWSVRDNHCSTLKQYIISAFTPKGRLRRRDFFVTLLVLMSLTDLGIHVSAIGLALSYVDLSDFGFVPPNITTCQDWWHTLDFFNVSCLADTLDTMILFFFPYLRPFIFPWMLSLFDNYRVVFGDGSISLYEIFWLLAIVYLTICSCIRRLHDSGHRGWYFLFTYIPLANLYLLYLLFFAADKDTNRYGSDPRKPYEGQYNS